MPANNCVRMSRGRLLTMTVVGRGTAQLFPCCLGDIMWRLGRKGDVHASVVPTELHVFEEPLNFNWTKVTSNISCIALGHGSAWVVTNDGLIKSQLELTRSKFYTDTWNLISWPQSNGKVSIFSYYNAEVGNSQFLSHYTVKLKVISLLSTVCMHSGLSAVEPL